MRNKDVKPQNSGIKINQKKFVRKFEPESIEFPRQVARIGTISLKKKKKPNKGFYYDGTLICFALSSFHKSVCLSSDFQELQTKILKKKFIISPCGRRIRKKLRSLIFLMLLLFFPINAFNQDPQFSQFYAAPLYLAPSFAGATGNTRLVLNFRDQWPKIPGSYVTYAFSADTYLPEYKSGIGLMFFQDQAGGGKLNTTNIAGQYAYSVKAGNTWRVHPGLQFLYYQKQLNYNDLIFNDQMSWDGPNPTSVEIPTDNRANHFDFAVSFLAHNEFMWFGTTADHLVRLNTALSENQDYLPMKFTAFGGGSFSLEKAHYKKDRNRMLLAFHYKSQGTNQQLDFGMYYQKLQTMFGIWYRGLPVFSKSTSHDALTLLAGYKINGISIGYSYDITISRLITHTGGAHEISLIYHIKQNPWSKKRRVTAVPCPVL